MQVVVDRTLPEFQDAFANLLRDPVFHKALQDSFHRQFGNSSKSAHIANVERMKPSSKQDECVKIVDATNRQEIEGAPPHSKPLISHHGMSGASIFPLKGGKSSAGAIRNK